MRRNMNANHSSFNKNGHKNVAKLKKHDIETSMSLEFSKLAEPIFGDPNVQRCYEYSLQFGNYFWLFGASSPGDYMSNSNAYGMILKFI